jgi:hypothetical protein
MIDIIYPSFLIASHHALGLVHLTVVHEADLRTDARIAVQAALAAGTKFSLSAQDGEQILRPSGPSRSLHDLSGLDRSGDHSAAPPPGLGLQPRHPPEV